MNDEEVTRGALISLIEGRKSVVFDDILNDIDYFFEKYSTIKELSLNQAAMIQSILLLGNRNEIMYRLVEYRNLQLDRTSEKDRWRKEVEGQSAINHFYEMVDGLLDKYLPKINNKLWDRFRLQTNEEYDHVIFQSLVRTFAYIFVTKLRMN